MGDPTLIFKPKGGGGGGGGGGDFSEASFTISWSGGPGDFKFSAASSFENIDISSFTDLLDGTLIAVRMDVTEAFAGGGITTLLATIGSNAVVENDAFKYESGQYYFTTGGLLNVLELIVNPGAFAAATSSGSYMPKWSAPQIKLDTFGTGLLGALTQGEATFTFFYLPPLLPS